jgi:hypothetical protein
VPLIEALPNKARKREGARLSVVPKQPQNEAGFSPCGLFSRIAEYCSMNFKAGHFFLP